MEILLNKYANKTVHPIATKLKIAWVTVDGKCERILSVDIFCETIDKTLSKNKYNSNEILPRNNNILLNFVFSIPTLLKKPDNKTVKEKLNGKNSSLEIVHLSNVIGLITFKRFAKTFKVNAIREIIRMTKR